MPARLRVIKGPMFSGKSTILIRIIDRAIRAGKRVLVIKPAIDSREYGDAIGARFTKADKTEEWVTYPAIIVRTKEEFCNALAEPHDVLVVDEAQFFDSWIVEELDIHLTHHCDSDLLVVVSGLDMDFARRPFGSMPQLLAMADEIECPTGICTTCGSEMGRFTQRLVRDTKTVIIGNKNYAVRCRKCHTILTPDE